MFVCLFLSLSLTCKISLLFTCSLSILTLRLFRVASTPINLFYFTLNIVISNSEMKYNVVVVVVLVVAVVAAAAAVAADCTVSWNSLQVLT